MNKGLILILILGALLTIILLNISASYHDHFKSSRGLRMSNDPIIYIYSPVIKASGYISFSAGNYDGIPVVVYQASILYMPSGQLMIGFDSSHNVTISMSNAVMQNITVYAANITATVLGITVTITPQNVGVLSIISEIVSELLPLYNVKIYAYYVNASSITYSSIELNA
jgi:D-glucosaminate-specific PTS system IID component